MTEYLLDSGFLYASIDNSDRHHEAVDAVTESLRGRVILPIPAITETTYFISANLGVEALAKFLESLTEDLFVLETPPIEDYIRSAEILRKYDDANLDFVDSPDLCYGRKIKDNKNLNHRSPPFQYLPPRTLRRF